MPVPVQRNTREENTRIKQGEVPEDWQKQTRKLQQKDTDARWVKKNGRSHYGYKNHVNVDRKHKLIRAFDVTDASVHDSRVFDRLLDSSNTGKQVFADSAYRSGEINLALKETRTQKRDSSQRLSRHAVDGSQTTGQSQTVKSSCDGGAHFRVSAELARWQIYTHDWNLKSEDKDRPDESGLQHETLRLSDKK